MTAARHLPFPDLRSRRRRSNGQVSVSGFRDVETSRVIDIRTHSDSRCSPEVSISLDDPPRARPSWHRVDLSIEVVSQARDLAEQLLVSFDDGQRRLRHTRAVAARAAAAAPAVSAGSENLLLAAAWLHDIGYVPALVTTGFHPLDGALHLQRHLWPPAVVGLVAHHSGARFMAATRGMSEQMALLGRPGYWCGPVADALTWADQTTGPTGQTVTAEQRIAEVLERHGPSSDQARAHEQRGPALLTAVRATEQRLATARPLTHCPA